MQDSLKSFAFKQIQNDVNDKPVVMAVFHHQLDNTFHEPFINVLVAKINNLKTKIMIKLKIPMI